MLDWLAAAALPAASNTELAVRSTVKVSAPLGTPVVPKFTRIVVSPPDKAVPPVLVTESTFGLIADPPERDRSKSPASMAPLPPAVS